jgi:hypothetical protein
MVAVLVGRMIEGMRGSASCEGLPICNWYVYWWIGAALGATTLPLLVLRRLTRRGHGTGVLPGTSAADSSGHSAK